MILRSWFTSVVILALAGCSETNTVTKYRDIGRTSNLLTTADLRMVTARRVPYGFDSRTARATADHEVICTEPSPDVAKALSTLTSGSFSLNLNLPIAGAVVNEAGSAEGTRATAEQLAQLTERVPPIQALRDGLYRACEAYANQVIGRNAYALILSRYGELLTTLLLASAAASEYGKQPLLKLDGVQFAIPPKPQDNKSATASSDKGKSASAGSAATSTGAVSTGSGSGLVLKIADRSDSRTKPATSARSGTTGSSPGGATAAVLTAIGGNVPAAMEAMQFNYMRLNHITPIMVLCANNMDKSLPAFEQLEVWPTPEMCDSLLKKVVNGEIAARNGR